MVYIILHKTTPQLQCQMNRATLLYTSSWRPYVENIIFCVLQTVTMGCSSRMCATYIFMVYDVHSFYDLSLSLFHHTWISTCYYKGEPLQKLTVWPKTNTCETTCRSLEVSVDIKYREYQYILWLRFYILGVLHIGGFKGAFTRCAVHARYAGCSVPRTVWGGVAVGGVILTLNSTANITRPTANSPYTMHGLASQPYFSR